MRASTSSLRFGRSRTFQWGVIVVVLVLAAARFFKQERQPTHHEEAAQQEQVTPSEIPTQTLAPTQSGLAAQHEAAHREEYQLRRVVDGDTLLLADGSRVRLLGVDTAEVFERNGSGNRLATPEKWGPEASAFTKQFVAGSRVQLEFDQERQDKFGRLLAYVWVGDKMLNEELLRAGLAKFLPHYPYSAAMKRRFALAQQEAQQHHRGRWSSK